MFRWRSTKAVNNLQRIYYIHKYYTYVIYNGKYMRNVKGQPDTYIKLVAVFIVAIYVLYV